MTILILCIMGIIAGNAFIPKNESRKQSPLAMMPVCYRLLLCCMILAAMGCKPDEDGFDGSHKYPDYVGKIMRRKCSTSGCHNDKSYEAAAGLNLDSWVEMFKGARGGSPVIPYSPDQSYLLYSINTDTSLGPTLSPTMPFGQPALSAAEYNDLRQWILDGARNDEGKERFPPLANRRKWYVGNQGCDLVAVFDAETRQIMRYVTVGNRQDYIERPHHLVISPDKKHWYVVFGNLSPHIEKYSTLTDEKLKDIDLGHNGWNTMAITPDGQFGFVVAEFLREVRAVDLENDAIVGPVTYLPQNVHGPAIHPTRSTLYLACNQRSELLLLDFDGNGNLSNLRSVDAVQGVAPAIAGELWPYEIEFLPDGSKYYVPCLHSDEVRVFDGATDQLLEVIEVGSYPVNLSISPSSDRLFVTCMEDSITLSGGTSQKGAIAVINTGTDQLETTVYSGYQPYGIAVDEAGGYVVISNRNLSPSGPGSHHRSLCTGRNGYVTAIDLHTLQLLPGFKSECSVDPTTVLVK